MSAEQYDVLINGVPAWYVYGDRQNGRSGSGGADTQLRDAGIVMGTLGGANNVNSGLVEFAVKGHGALDSGTLAYVKALRYTGVAGGLLGIGLSGAQVYNDITTGNPVNPWDVADIGVGAVGTVASITVAAGITAASGPVGWVIGGTAVYFGGRLIQNMAIRE